MDFIFIPTGLIALLLVVLISIGIAFVRGIFKDKSGNPDAPLKVLAKLVALLFAVSVFGYLIVSTVFPDILRTARRLLD